MEIKKLNVDTVGELKALSKESIINIIKLEKYKICVKGVNESQVPH